MPETSRYEADGPVASWMALSNQMITAEQARVAGFVAEVVPHERFEARVREMAQAIAATDLPTLRAIKEKLRAATFGSVNDALYAVGPWEAVPPGATGDGRGAGVHEGWRGLSGVCKRIPSRPQRRPPIV